MDSGDSGTSNDDVTDTASLAAAYRAAWHSCSVRDAEPGLRTDALGFRYHGAGEQVPRKDEAASQPVVDEIDAGWDDDEDEQPDDDAADEDVDAGWDAADAADGALTPEAREREWRGLTPEERQARTARAAARREKLRAKTAEKVERRKARASVARSKQKQKQKQKPRAATLGRQLEPRAPSAERRVAASEHVSPGSPEPPRRALTRRNDPRVIGLLAAIVLIAGGIALFLWKR